MAPPKKAHVYDTNQRVLCKHGNFFYEAKVVDKKDDPSGEVKYLIHYQGWHKRHDEWFPQSDTADKFKPFSDEALAAAKLEVKEASQSKSTKKKHKPDLDEDMRKSETGSRGSTPSDRAGGSTKANSTVSEKTNKGTSRGTKRRLSAAAPTPVGSNAFVEPMKDTFMRPTEIMIRLPQKLKQILVDDNDMINRQYKIIRLPAEHTVEMIIKDYCDNCGTSTGESNVDEVLIEYDNGKAITNSNQLIQSSLGLKEYFDVLLGYQLLYKFERPQYSEQLEKSRQGGKEGSTSGDGPAAKRRKTVKTPEPAQSIVELKPSKVYGLPHLLRLLSRFDVYLKLTTWSDRTLNLLMTSVHDFLVFLNKNADKYYVISRDYDVASPEYQRQAFAT